MGVSISQYMIMDSAIRAKALWKSIISDGDLEEKIAGLSEEDALLLGDHPEICSIYSFPTIADGRYASFQYINLQEEFQRRLTLTSMSAFLFRMLDEYENDIDGNPITPEVLHGIRTFLNQHLEFNPDIHVRKANQKKEDYHVHRPDLYVAKGLKEPPEDTFARFGNYYTVEYDNLLAATQALYNVVPEFDSAINIVTVQDSEVAAKEFCHTHQADFTTDVLTVRMGKWAFTAPHTANRQKLDIYNKDNRILEDILKYKKEEEKLGIDMIKQRVKNTRRRNRSDMLDPEMSRQCEKLRNIIDKSNIKMETLTEADHRERERLRLKRERAQRQLDTLGDIAETPDDAVRVDVFNVDGNKMEKSAIFIKAETQDEVETRRRLAGEAPTTRD